MAYPFPPLTVIELIDRERQPAPHAMTVIASVPSRPRRRPWARIRERLVWLGRRTIGLPP